MATIIQTKFQYTFVHDWLFCLALKSAHRDSDNEHPDDGNRGLAHYGILAIQMTETYDAIMKEGKALRDVHIRDHWSKTKKGRARVCRRLGIEPFITQSPRQWHQPPSDTVLDNALSALLGAIWLDCERQERTTAATRHTIWEVLRNIDAILDEKSCIACCGTDTLQSQSHQSSTISDCSIEQSGASDLVVRQELDDIGRFAHDWFEHTLGDLSSIPLPYEDIVPEQQRFPVEAGSTVSLEGQLTDGIRESVSTSSIQHHTACARSNVQFRDVRSQYTSQGAELHSAQRKDFCFSELQNAHDDITMTATKTKRKRSQDRGEKIGSVYQGLLHSEQQKLMWVSQDDKERLTRFLEHFKLDKLERKTSILPHFLYLAIGSWQTIDDFRDQLRLARSVRKQSSISTWSAAETYDEICRLDKEEALSVLLRRYHTVNLCEEEQVYNDNYSHIIVETPSTVGVAGRANAGNPVLALDASLTDKLLFKIMPDTNPRSNEFKKARPRVKRLRKLARYLRGLVKSYGFGILALLPSGASFGELSLTDSMLMSMTETSFNGFTQLLHQEQGPLLESLSRAIEPSLLALVNGCLESDMVYLAESIDTSILSKLPKGLLRLS